VKRGIIHEKRMKDGLYQVTTTYLCAGFVVKNNQVIACAPILRRKLSYWKTIAKRITGETEKSERIDWQE
jgi:hypothetical protein